MKKSLQLLFSISSLAFAAFLVSGCAAAVMTGAKTAKGSESNNVVIVSKSESISAINHVTVDTSGLRNDDTDKQKEIAERLSSLFIENLKSEGIYAPENSEAYSVTVTVRNMKREINERAVYAIVNVLNANKEAVFSFASVETSLGLRTIDYVEETFAKSAVEEIARPYSEE